MGIVQPRTLSAPEFALAHGLRFCWYSLLYTNTTTNTQLLGDECLFVGRVDLDT